MIKIHKQWFEIIKNSMLIIFLVFLCDLAHQWTSRLFTKIQKEEKKSKNKIFVNQNEKLLPDIDKFCIFALECEWKHITSVLLSISNWSVCVFYTEIFNFSIRNKYFD